MINSIIVQHLKHNKRLVVPGFGAFIKKDETGEVVFVEFLKKDDGVLVSALQQSFSLARNEAVEVIDNYIVETKRQIHNAGSFIIGGLGTMHVDANSAYNFEYCPIVAEDKSVKSRQSTEIVAGEVKPLMRQEVRQQINQPPTQAVVPQSAPTIAPQPTPTQQPPTQQIESPTTIISAKLPDKEVFTGLSSKEEDSIEISGLQYQKPIKPLVLGQNKKKADMIMLIAIVAATIAIVAMIYGIFSSSSPGLTLEPRSVPQEVPQQVQDAGSVAPSK